MNSQYDDRDRGGINTFGAFVVGAIAGAIAVFFSDKGNRERVKSTVRDMMETGEEKVTQAQEAIAEVRDKGKRRIAEELDKTKRKLESDLDNTNRGRERGQE